jgi:hypothetical protein
MFYQAPNFNQDLCSWGDKVLPNPTRSAMFSGTACPIKTNPVLTSSPKGPFCYVCPPPPSPPVMGPTPVPTMSPTSDFFETGAELRAAITSGVYTAGNSPYGAIELWDVSRFVLDLSLPTCYSVDTLSKLTLPSALLLG